jgi:hydrogenase-1 operon protein HyaF
MSFTPTPFPIPVRSLLPEPTDAVDYMPMPREMSTFTMPALPEPGPGSDVAGAHTVLQQFLVLMDDWLAAGTPDPKAALPALDLAGLPAATLRVVNETLGEGEVSAIVEAAHEVRVQETVFSGVWREQHLRGTHLLHDHLLAAPIPPIVLALAQQRAGTTLRSLPLPAGAMNVPALLHELQDAMDKSGPGTPAHVLNLTLLPLSPEDSAHLAAVLDGGSVVVLSRGFGNCRISSTAARNVWRVQYFNNMNTLILDTIEVVTMPEVAVAAPEDIAETRNRLHELVQWMGESVASA